MTQTNLIVIMCSCKFVNYHFRLHGVVSALPSATSFQTRIHINQSLLSGERLDEVVEFHTKPRHAEVMGRCSPPCRAPCHPPSHSCWILLLPTPSRNEFFCSKVFKINVAFSVSPFVFYLPKFSFFFFKNMQDLSIYDQCFMFIWLFDMWTRYTTKQ